MSSMVWFPAPEVISPQMQEVLEFEKMLLSSPFTAIATLFVLIAFMLSIVIVFWKHSLKIGVIILNLTVIGKVVFAYLFTGDSGAGTLGTAFWGLVLINGIAAIIFYYNKRRKNQIE
ncbi:hypothetical protein GOQ27_13315 [Clostridium sp. D2Q-11]|uniref:Uncharacterized protein n=1 Tax=Anaeromonas frigoriresistens TaxID=2683708 RepID=A0A942UZ31_9FIRM|nr:hypothetical protein [Anaeromonas frigoriresistens]MBS4539449.1 hypothetical protein [Anaeromonas frigoriresistens]